jgi:hypothetical protein
MKSVRVQYTVKKEYVETNKKNIRAVMNHLKNSPTEGMWYRAFLLEDGQSFMHINICTTEEIMNKLNEVDLFMKFRNELKASGPVSPPKSENIMMISSE